MNLEQFILLQGLTAEEMHTVRSMLRVRPLVKGELLVQEGESADEIFFIHSGSLAVLKRDWAEHKQHQLNIVKAGDCIGESALIADAKRQASLQALTSAEIYGLLVADLKKFPEIFRKVSDNCTRQFSSFLEGMNENSIVHMKRSQHELQKRVALGKVTMLTILFLASYIIVGSIFFFFTPKHYWSQVVIGLMTLVTIGLILLLKNNRLIRGTCGLTLHGWKRAALEGIAFSIPLMVLIYVLKPWLGEIFHVFSKEPFYYPYVDAVKSWIAPHSIAEKMIALVMYAIFVPMQELIFRGLIQGPLQRMLVGRWRVVQAILAANLAFIVVHIPLSLIFPLFAFIPGLLWGYLFFRHRNLVGCSVSHILIGVWAFSIELPLK